MAVAIIYGFGVFNSDLWSGENRTGDLRRYVCRLLRRGSRTRVVPHPDFEDDIELMEGIDIYPITTSMAFNKDSGLFWDDDDDTHPGKGIAFSELDREWEARHNQFHTLGYRDGLLAGKESFVQEGFNNGFKESIMAGWNWGLVRGVTSAFVFLPEHVKEQLVEKSEARSKLQALHGKVCSISTKDALKLFHEDVLKRKEGHSTNIVQVRATLVAISNFGLVSKILRSLFTVHSEGGLQTLEGAENSKASYDGISEFGDLQRQANSLLESLPFKPSRQSH